MKETRPASLPRKESRRLVRGGRAAGLGYHSRASAWWPLRAGKRGRRRAVISPCPQLVGL